MRSALLFAVLLAGFTSLSPQTPVAPAHHTFNVANGQFQLDGHPFQILSGEMHYPRVPRAYWRDRFRKARAMGLNTITTYVFWNIHEPRPGVYDFSGQNDVAEYIREAQQEGLYVILRPGPYVCAEWDLGGYPSWLLKDRTLVLRSYRSQIHRRHESLVHAPGPRDHSAFCSTTAAPSSPSRSKTSTAPSATTTPTWRAVKSALLNSPASPRQTHCSTQPTAPTSSPTAHFPNFLPSSTSAPAMRRPEFADAQETPSRRPLHVRRILGRLVRSLGRASPHHRRRPNAAEYEWMLQPGILRQHVHVSRRHQLRMDERRQQQRHQLRARYHQLRLRRAPQRERPAHREIRGFPRGHHTRYRQNPSADSNANSGRNVSRSSPRIESASLWQNLPAPVESDKLLTMEDLDQSYGYILYRTQMAPGPAGQLAIDGLHDYAQIYIDRKLIGTLDRRLGQSSLAVPAVSSSATLDILVENTGRVNFTKVIRTERKGITGSVTVGGRAPQHWQIYSLPLSDLSRLHFLAAPCEGPCFYRFTLAIPVSKATNMPYPDTYLNTHAVSKGMAFLNGRPLGRFWSVGPEFTLYTPGPWLHPGSNQITIFDLQGTAHESLATTDHADYGPR